LVDVSNRQIAEITIAAAILRFTAQTRANPSSILVRIAPDILIDLIGKEKFMSDVLNGVKFLYHKIRVVSDDNLEYGSIVAGWMN
jgi:hypothetical protein